MSAPPEKNLSLPVITIAPTLSSASTSAASGFVLDMLGEAFVSNRDGHVSRQRIDGKVLALTLFKRAGTRSRDGPFWPCVVKGEPEIDVTGLKRHQKTMSELYEDPAMASLLHSMQMQQANAMDPMSEEMMGGMGLPTGPAWQ